MNLGEKKRLMGSDRFVAELKIKELKPSDAFGHWGLVTTKVSELIEKHNKLVDLLVENNVI